MFFTYLNWKVVSGNILPIDFSFLEQNVFAISQQIFTSCFSSVQLLSRVWLFVTPLCSKAGCLIFVGLIILGDKGPKKFPAATSRWQQSKLIISHIYLGGLSSVGLENSKSCQISLLFIYFLNNPISNWLLYSMAPEGLLLLLLLSHFSRVQLSATP